MFLLADGYIYIVNSLSQEKLHCIRFYVGGKRIQKVLENDSVPELEEINIFFYMNNASKWIGWQT